MDGHGARSRRRLQESQTSGVDNDQTAQPDSGGAASSILLLLFLLQASVREHQLEAALWDNMAFL